MTGIFSQISCLIVIPGLFADHLSVNYDCYILRIFCLIAIPGIFADLLSGSYGWYILLSLPYVLDVVTVIVIYAFYNRKCPESLNTLFHTGLA